MIVVLGTINYDEVRVLRNFGRVIVTHFLILKILSGFYVNQILLNHFSITPYLLDQISFVTECLTITGLVTVQLN